MEEDLCFPQLLNISCKRPKNSASHIYPGFLFLSFISLMTAVLNLLVIISVSHFRQLHTPTNFLLLSLAVSDFFVGLLLLFQIMLLDGCWYFGDLMCVLFVFLGIIITSASIGNMVLISIDRYVAICDPLHYSAKVTAKKVQICVSLCWTTSLCYAIVLFRDNLKHLDRFNTCFGECVINMGFIEQVASLCFTFIVPITVIIVLYLRVFVVVVSQIRAIHTQNAAVKHHYSGKVTAKKSEIKAARTLGVVVVVFLVCLCPYFCVTLSGQNSSINTSSVVFVVCLFYFNSFLNPLIYAFFYPWFRRSVKLIFTLQVLKTGSSDAKILY
ncbi:trace amine-associated receptor 1-like [Kryptolebias marmoratus]|uniref:trace amine-associated receptor 1-like n=1 Tax=Kryptolebias marmoratus TaxID=37003 RepID=UPI0007F90874|nr:trace amine-associated receptor 1-like [Kryptolebias marmoratus]